jgi:hypothetical protein
MSRRRSDGPTLSLLAFQDIITSVTAILLLVTLMLAMELTRPAGASAGADASLSQELQETIDRLTDERSDLRKALDTGATQLDAQAAVDPRQLERQIGEAGLALDRQIRSNEARARKLAEAELERQRTEAARFDRSEDVRKLETMDREVGELKAEAQRAVRMVGRLSDRTGWRVELTGTAVRLTPMKLQEPPPSFPEVASAPTKPEIDPASAAFLQWFRSGPNRRRYLLFVVRPSGIVRFAAIREAIDQIGVSYGYEAVGEDQILADPNEE